MTRTTALLALSTAALADPATIDAVKPTQTSGGWRFDVTISHPDTGWDDYADGWRIESEDGTILGTRVLAHPHVNEQPFTRSLSGVNIPDGVTEVFIRASESVGGWADSRVLITLP